MKLSTALKLAARHGKVERRGDDDHVNVYVVVVNDRNAVSFQAGHVRPTTMLRALNQDIEQEVYNVAHTWLDEEANEWQTMGCRTLAGALCNAKYEQFDADGVLVKVSYHAPNFKRVVKVVVHGAEVNGGGEYRDALALDAIRTRCVGPLLDWVELNAVARTAELILV